MPTYQRIVWIGLAVTAIAILVLGYFLFLAPAGRKKGGRPSRTPLRCPGADCRPPPRPATRADPAIVPLDLDLDRSDEAVRELVAAAEIPAAMKAWLRQKEIVRTVVAVVDNIAQGQSPAAQLPFLAPAGKVHGRGERRDVLPRPAQLPALRSPGRTRSWPSRIRPGSPGTKRCAPPWKKRSGNWATRASRSPSACSRPSSS